MKRFALCAAIVALMAAPLLAEPTPIKLNDIATITKTPIDGGTRDLPGRYQLWDGLLSAYGGGGTTGHWGWAASHLTGPVAFPSWTGWVGEDMHLVDHFGCENYSITNFHFVAFGGPHGDFSTTGYYTMLVGWKTHPEFSVATPTLGAVSGATIGLFSLTGLTAGTPGNPGGGWIWTITFTNPFSLGAADVWMFMANNAASQPDGAPLRYGMTADGLAPPTPAPTGAATHSYIFSGSPWASPHTGSFLTLTGGYGPLMMAWALHFPEPASLLLLAGGLLVLRRRR